jgi:hypothetical protein
MIRNEILMIRNEQMVKEISDVITERSFSFRSEQQQRNA